MRQARTVALCVLALAALWSVGPAQASFGFKPGAEGFAVTVTDAGVMAPGDRPGAGEHPDALAVKLALRTAGEYSDGDLRNLQLDLPPGFLVNPTATEECTAPAFHTPRSSPYEASASGESCPIASQVGTLTVRSGPGGATVRNFGLFNLVAPYGAPGAIGASPYGVPVVLTPRVREADAGLTFGLEGLSQGIDFQALELTIWGTPWAYEHDGERGNCLNEEDPAAHHGTLPVISPFQPGTCTVGNPEFLKDHEHSFLTLPTTPCGAPLGFAVRADSWQGGAQSTAEAQALDGEGHTTLLHLCRTHLTVPKLQLSTERAASGTGLVFNLDVNDGGGILNPRGIARPAIRNAILTLPEGVTINPSLGSGLGVCSAADFARESVDSPPGAGCPGASKVGSVEAQGMLGLPEPLEGAVFLATPHANPSGSLIALYMVARNPRRGLFVRSEGQVAPDPRTGALVATFQDLPRLLYTHFNLTLREGQRAALVSPPACGHYPTDVALASWATPTAFTHDQTSYIPISQSAASGPCPPALRPFAPGLQAGSTNPSPAASSSFFLRMTRTDEEQEITSYAASFPPGLLAKIAGVGECPDAAIAAASGRSGAAEEASPSCPESSRIGHTMAGYGVGGTLAWAPGGLYLAGPWHGEPLSVVAIDSAKVGPFDLGTVVVRTAVHVDTRRAQASIDPAGSDPIPHILAGIPLHVRDIRVYIDRPGFILNGTSCDPLSVSSTLTGAGTDPFHAGDETSASSSQRFQLLGCGALGFGPRLSLRLRGATRRGAYPSLRAVVRPRPGQANIGAAAVTLPPSLFLAQEHLREVCTRAQFAAGGGGGAGCPKGSVYGHARAWTPLLDGPLEGPVFIRSSDHPVPDLVASLSGHGLTVVLEGRIDSVKGGLRGSFEGLPDAPLTKFVMTLPGGRHGLLSVAEDLCAHHRRANSRWIAQDNATAALRPKLNVKCASEPKQRKGHRRPAPRRATASEMTQRGNLRVALDAKIAPKALPRHGVAPVAVSLAGRIGTADGSSPPQLRRVTIAINRHGHLDTTGLPVCRLEEIQPASTANALHACGSARVGEGRFSADVVIPEQSPFPSDGKVIAFNGVEGGHPVIFAHVYGTKPIPTSFTLPLKIGREKGRFGTVLTASLPDVTSKVAVVTGISLTLHRTFHFRGRPHSYLSAGCPAPKGFPGALYPLARATFSFARGRALSSTVTRSCRATSG